MLRALGCLSMAVGLTLFVPGAARAQVTPAEGYTPPDDTPNLRVGGTLFLDYTFTDTPKTSDADGNTISPNAFNVGRAYINVNGQLNHVVQFRVTPDISREAGTGSTLNGSLTFRLKYVYAQVNLDDWLWKGTYVRMGMLPTPVVNFEEDTYRYRFQGPVFADREGFLSSSDYGVMFRTQLPSGYGEVMGGVYNGETYARPEPNDQKAYQIRATVRPFPGPGIKRGLRVTGFYDDDHYVRGDDRRRLETMVSFEHRYANAAWVHLDANDQATHEMAKVHARGDSFWVTPRSRIGVEGLLRYDRLDPNRALDSLKERWIAGAAYWPHMTAGSVSSAFMLDFEEVRYRDYAPARPLEKRIAVHLLLTY